MPSGEKNDGLTVTAIAVLAMCAVTFTHEALGHGTACIALHGHIRLLTSSLFGCEIKSEWIDLAGPAANVLLGTAALIGVRFVRRRLPIPRLFMILVMAFAYFWESGYLIRAMMIRAGDLYYFSDFVLGRVVSWQAWIMAGAGLAIYLWTVRITSDAIRALWSEAKVARRIGRIAWISATVGAAIAALAYAGRDWNNLQDAVLEIGGASFPLLFIPLGDRRLEGNHTRVVISRSPFTICLSLMIYAAFIATLGHGIIQGDPSRTSLEAVTSTV